LFSDFCFDLVTLFRLEISRVNGLISQYKSVILFITEEFFISPRTALNEDKTFFSLNLLETTKYNLDEIAKLL